MNWLNPLIREIQALKFQQSQIITLLQEQNQLLRQLLPNQSNN